MFLQWAQVAVYFTFSILLSGSSDPLWYDNPSPTLTCWPKEVAGGICYIMWFPGHDPVVEFVEEDLGFWESAQSSIATEREEQAPSLLRR